jgi:hypothetical protein
MAIKQMVQWAPGTKPQRMNRSDGVYRSEMDALHAKPAIEVEAPRPQPFCFSELVWFGGEIGFLGKVDPNGHWVEWHNAKVDPSCFKKLPDWFRDEYSRLEGELTRGA